MKYALKITRDTRSNCVTVHPVMAVPNTATPYRLKYRPPYGAESLQVFDSLENAETARAAELLVVDLGKKSAAVLLDALGKSLFHLELYGLSAARVCALSGLNYHTLLAYRQKSIPPNPRFVAKILLIAEKLNDVANFSSSILPDMGAAGNPRKSRGGNPGINGPEMNL